MDDYLDSSVGNDPKLLQNILRSLSKERDSLEKQLSGVGSLEGGNEWLKVIADVRVTVGELETLHSNSTSIAQTDLVRGDCAQRVGGGAGACVGGGAGACVEALRPLVEELTELERVHSYLAWIKRINQLCREVERHLSSGLLSDALSAYTQLSSLSVTLETSSCSHLRHYVLSSKQHWHSRLTQTLSSDFGVILKEFQWPFTTSAISSKVLEAWNKSKKRFTEVFSLLIELDDRGSPVNEAAVQLNDPLLGPLELLVQPLRKRFKYHFFGERKTNSKEKPEWYLTQVSGWIRDHSHFLEERIQPLLSASGRNHIDARVEFIRGLLQEVETKVQADLTEVVYDDALMSHLIDELLIFERELRMVLQYPCPCPTPFDVLLGEVPFHKWLSLEKAFAIERMNTIVSSESAWQPAYDGMANADDTRVPQCTEGIMELIKGITDRYSSLSSVRHQLQFLELQRDLLLEFHHDLVANSDEQGGVGPLHTQFMAYLNASNYITTVLKEWGEQMFFLELYYHTQEGGATRPPLTTIQLLRRQDSDYASSEGSAFSIVVEAFFDLVGRLKKCLVDAVVESVRERTYKYKKEKWHSMTPAGKDELARDVSQSAAELTTLLREHLRLIEDQLSPLLSSDVFEQIIISVDKLIFSEVVLPNYFSEGGAEQLHHDVTAALRPLLAKFTDEMSSRQLMERTIEACKLLQLLPGSAKLMLSLLQQAVRSGQVRDDTYSEAVSALNDMGVHTIDPTLAEKVLKLRILPS